ncbi:hypothetical protein P3X46_032115 [Hevea brasiliensis]|uniref:Glutamate decarboxylase n=1 Tax=Hevea brasiliensis TaxID=3981 RepID=A0ABQ9KN51_HEVBR|nr:hypothetical protein P3X46_032115 [Hevea brasiliensis]
MDNTRVLKEGLEKTGRFGIVSKDVGVPLVAFSLKDSSKYTVFDMSESLRRFGWIIPAYTMPADAKHIAVLRVVVREDFSRSLAERLSSNIEQVLEEMDSLPIRTSTKSATASGELENAEGKKIDKKTEREIQEEIIQYWRRLVDGKRIGVC